MRENLYPPAPPGSPSAPPPYSPARCSRTAALATRAGSATPFSPGHRPRVRCVGRHQAQRPAWRASRRNPRCSNPPGAGGGTYDFPAVGRVIDATSAAHVALSFCAGRGRFQLMFSWAQNASAREKVNKEGEILEDGFRNIYLSPHPGPLPRERGKGRSALVIK